ncbi:TonB-dependent receptor [Novosphingobium sp.]|uniref:TonB-dependent receptor n=1 Tax=Novosphingobium sp. TaxID=1874826 RepID=UPI0025E9602B|nr:TonB-dependent receptor [Novosphingobium sp.]MCC6927342.1 TonB-dependent receptor [Novosphingobium sp.]
MARNTPFRAALIGGSAILALVATSAQAQDVPGGDASDEEIVVTARKVEEKLQDVPIAVTALSGATLEARGIGSVTELSRVSPNLQFTPGQGGNSGAIAPFIRGVGENDFIITSDPAVGTYFDGVYVARTFGALAELLDVERIEVLRGPQGSLFGKNTIGGAINVISKLPGDTTELSGDARYGSYNDVRLRARVSVPLGEGLAISLSGLGEWGDGWQHIPSGKDLGNRNVITGKAVLRYQSGPFEAIWSADALRRRQNSAAHSMIDFVPTFFSGLQSGFIAPCCTVPADIDHTDTTPALNRDNADAFNTSLTLSYDLGGGKLKSITAYRKVDALFGRDGDASAAVNYAADIHDENAKQFSQELQYSASILGEGSLLLGAYYYREKSIDLTRLYVADGLYDAIKTTPPFSDPAFPGGPPLAVLLDFNLDFDNRQTTTNYGLFGNVSLPLGEKVKLELGGRYTHEKKSFFQAATRIYSGAPLLAGTPSYTLEKEWDAFTPRVSLSWKPQDNLMLYGSWSRGFRSGGFNGRPTSLEEVGIYNPEHLDAFEVGMKGEFGGVLTLNLAAFYNKYRDQQLLISTVSQTTGLIVVRTENAGRSKIEGIELEAAVKVTPRLRLDGSLGILGAKYQQYTSVIAGVPTDVSFRTPKQAPDLSASLGLSYTLPLGDTGNAVFRVDTAYRSKAFIDVENTPELAAREHAIVNASATFDLPVSGLSLRLAVDNLTKQRIVTAGYDARGSFGFVEAYFNEPRRFWVTLAFQR